MRKNNCLRIQPKLIGIITIMKDMRPVIHLRDKKRDYLKGKLSEIETYSKNKNIRVLCKGIKDFK